MSDPTWNQLVFGEEPDDDWDDDPDDEEFDCGWIDDDIGCLMAGTEDCDFECPYSDTYYIRRNAIAIHNDCSPPPDQ